MLAVVLPTLRHFRVVNLVALVGTTYTTWFIVATAARHGMTPGAASRCLLLSPRSQSAAVHEKHSCWQALPNAAVTFSQWTPQLLRMGLLQQRLPGPA